MINIVTSYLTKNPCYNSKRMIKVQGLTLHSIGCPQPNAQVFIKNWNSSSYNRACVHGFIDNTGCYITLPCMEETQTSKPGYGHRGWHIGKGSKGSANNTHLGFEMTEPSYIKYTGGATFTCSDIPKAQAFVKKNTENAVELFAKLCIYHNLDPLGKNVIISHKEGYSLGIGSNHSDPEHLWNQLNMNYTMDNFRQDVYNKVQELKTGINNNNNEEDEDMDTKTFEKLFNEFRGTLRDNDCSGYSAEARAWAIKNGLIAGTGQTMPDGSPNYAWQDILSREQFITVLYRFAKYLDKA